MACDRGARAAKRYAQRFGARSEPGAVGLMLRRALAACAIWVTLVPITAAGEATQVKASTSRESRDDAIKSIPFEELSAATRKQLSDVVHKPCIFRRLPIQVIDCENDLYQFLVRNPEVVVGIWDVMGISKVVMQRQDDFTYIADDGAGTSGTVRYVYSNKDTHVIYSEGVYDGPMFHRPVKGRCVMVVKSGAIRENGGRHYISSRVDTFIQLDHSGLELLAKTFQPLLGRLADHNFAETAGFLASLSRTAEVNGPGVQRLAHKLTTVDTVTREQFALLAGDVAAKITAPEPTDVSATPSGTVVRTVHALEPEARRN